jgi:hypothetical protein
MALSQALHRVAELEDQLSKAKAASSAQRSQRAASFLGGAFLAAVYPPRGSWGVRRSP